jgi:hypothetical protein
MGGVIRFERPVASSAVIASLVALKDVGDEPPGQDPGQIIDADRLAA